MDKLKVEWRNNTDGVNGMYTPVIFCYISADNKQCNHWRGCTGYMFDAWEYCQRGDDYGDIYHPLCMDKLSVGITKLGDVTKAKTVQKLVNNFATPCGLDPIKVYQSNKPYHYVIKGPGDWMESTFMLSLLFNLIRCVHAGAPSGPNAFRKWAEEFCEKKQPTPFTAKSQIDSVWKYIPKIIEARKGLVYKTGLKYPKGGCHSWGIATMMRAQYQKVWDGHRYVNYMMGHYDDAVVKPLKDWVESVRGDGK